MRTLAARNGIRRELEVEVTLPSPTPAFSLANSLCTGLETLPLLLLAHMATSQLRAFCSPSITPT
jgi:hypothetical protein